MPETLQLPNPAPLTTLTEDEILFRDNVRQFAEDKIRPLAKEMDEKAVFDHGLIDQFFQLGLMGIEVPEQYGGAGGKFFEAILAVEECSRADASAGVIVDVQNTLVANAILRWASEDQKKRYLPKLTADTVGAYALSEAGSGSDAFALQTKAELKGSDFILNGRGATDAEPAPGVIEAIRSADLVLLAPSNPVTSIAPILAVPGIRETLRESRARIVAVSPIVGGAAVSGPAGILMAAQGLPVSIAGVADFYHDFLDLLVVDSEDAAAAEELRKTGMRVHCTSTIMRKNEDRVALAKSVLDAAKQHPSAQSAVERP